MIAVLGVIGYMSFAYAIYVWAIRTSVDEQQVLGVVSVPDNIKRETEIIDLAPYLESTDVESEQIRRAA